MDDLPINNKVVELDAGNLHLETSSNSPKLKAAEQDCNGGIVNDHNQKNDDDEEVIVDNGEEPKSNGHHASSCDPDVPDPDPTESPQGEINPSPPAPIPIEEKEDTQLQVVKTEETPIEQEEEREAQVQVVRQEEKSPIEEEEESRDSQLEVVKQEEETPIEEEEKRDTQVEVVKQEEETPIEEEESRDSQVDVAKQGEETAIEEDEKSDVQVEIVKQEEETKHNDADVKLEGLKCEIDDDQIENINAPIEEQDKLDSDVIVEETREPITEGADILNSESNLPDDDNKVEEETKPEEVHGQQKVEDQAKIKCESVSKESPELDSQIEVTDHLESELHQPCGQEDKLASSEEETEENQNSHLPVVEHAESEPLQVTIEEDAAEQSNLQSSAEVCHDTLITATDAVETEPCQPDDEKECRTAELADDIPVSQPSTHLESEYLKSGSVDVQLEVESTNGTDEVEGNKAKSLVEQTVFETELVNGSAEGQKIESEPLLANGHVENAELASSSCVELKPETDVQNVSAENGEGLSAAPVACADLETEVVQVSVEGDESNIIYSVDDAKAEARLGNGSIQEDNSIPAVPDLHLERETGAMNGFTERASLPADPLDDTQSEFDGGDSNPASKEELSSTVTGKLESLVSNGPVVNGESKPGSVNDVKTIESEGDQSSCGDSNTKSMREGDGIEVVGCNGSLSPSPEDSVIEVEKRPFRFLIRVPRYIDDKIKIQIELAQKQVDERTRNRDDIRSTIQSRRAACDELRDKFEAARSEERAARDALHAKRHEMDSVQSVINRVKNETSIEDIDYRVRSMEHRIEHETVPLKEEKQLMREIKQLKQHREQLTSSLSQQAEHQPTSDERVQVEERFKLLKREMDSCRKEVMRLEGLTQAARKIYIDENEKIRDLQAQFRAGDDLRQEAYIQLQNLKKQLYEKNKYFRMYKEESRKAEDYSIAGDKESLQRFCVNQVETLMELWNTNDEFRKEYVRCNTNSTIRRLRTLDGRSLGPDEEPPLLHTGLNGRVDRSLPASANKIDFPSLPASERGKPVVQHVEAVVNLGQKNPKTDSKAVINLEQKPTAKSNKVIKPAGLESSTVTVSSGREEKPEDENKQSLEEVELARKAEELRRAEEAAKLKEQRRLEEKTKAKEAEERKRRNAEKAQARAELRAQKEAELKEKEREKKARKKERKKEKVEAATDGNEEESVSRSENTQAETTQEPEIKEKHKTVAKRPLKPSLLAKQAKPKVVPPPLPLRNRSKKRMQPWMWILLVVVVAIALFLVGNIGFSFKFGLPSFSGF